MKTISDFNVKNKRVLVRCDFNVPLSKEGIILDEFRIKKTIPTIDYLIKKKAKVILISHLGRPEGKILENLRLTPVQEKLIEYLDISLTKAPDCIGNDIKKWTNEMQAGEVLLLENLRFYKEEEENKESFSKELSELGDIYINDAFSVSHRKHASIVGVPKYLPSGIGLLMAEEIKVLTELAENPKKPLIALIGGKKVETKVKLIDKVSETADFVLIGGLLKREIKEKNIRLKNPQKVIGPLDEINGKDIGEETIRVFGDKILRAKTILWNGSFGQTEKEEYKKGTEKIARGIANSGAFSVIGGGETVEFVSRLGLIEKFSHVSTGGGAMLAFLSGDSLPGLEVLK